jgi:hypothetical protein
VQFQLARNWTAEPGFEVLSFGALYLPNRAELDFDSLTKVGVLLYIYAMVKSVDQIMNWFERYRKEKMEFQSACDWAADFSLRFPLSQLHIFQSSPS